MKTEESKSNVEETAAERIYTPTTDILQSKTDFMVICDMPGVSSENIDISLEEQVLSISGRQDLPECEGEWLYREFEPGIFKRSFKMPEAINQEAITATMKNGVLTLVLPKAEQKQPKKIQVHAA